MESTGGREVMARVRIMGVFFPNTGGARVSMHTLIGRGIVGPRGGPLDHEGSKTISSMRMCFGPGKRGGLRQNLTMKLSFTVNEAAPRSVGWLTHDSSAQFLCSR